MLKKLFSILVVVTPFLTGCYRYTNEEGRPTTVIFPTRGVMLTACNLAAPIGKINQAGRGEIVHSLTYGDCTEVPLIPANIINGESRIKLVFLGFSEDGQHLLGKAEKTFSVSSRGTRSDTWTIDSNRRGLERYSLLQENDQFLGIPISEDLAIYQPLSLLQVFSEVSK